MSVKVQHPQMPLRKSNRKAKKISKQIQHHPQKRKNVQLSSPWTCHHQERKVLPFLQTHYRQLMKIDKRKHAGRILQEMEGAIRQQSQKLQSFFQIKLELDQRLLFEDMGPLEMAESRPIEIDKANFLEQVLEEREEVVSLGDRGSVDFWSCPQSIEQKPVLRKHQSARLFCDNYQKRDLIYSYDTLIPRLALDDIEPFVGHFN